MLKATLRSAVLLGLLAWSAPGYAEVQNIRVSGEVTVRAFHRENLRLSDDVFNNSAAGSRSGAGAVDSLGGTTSDFGSGGDQFVQQLTALNIDADLTENVSASIRIINQRIWGALNDNAVNSSTTTGDAANDVQLSLANVTLRELFYSPLTLTLGRQNLWFGRGFILGSRLLNGDIDPDESLAADEYSDLSGFDAIRATIDLAGTAGIGLPAVVDIVYAKVQENNVSVGDSIAAGGTGASSADDVNLIFLNIGTTFDNGEAEIYFADKRNNALTVLNIRGKAKADTLGIRGSSQAVEGLDIWGELAYQWGHRITTAIAYDAEGASGDDYQAWAANFGADFTLTDVDWTPVVGGEWIFFSGDDGLSEGTDVLGSAIGGWDPVYRGKFTTLLREFQSAGFYMPAQSGATLGDTLNSVTNAYTNQHQLSLHAAISPIEDLTVDNKISWFIADKGIRAAAASSAGISGTKREHFIGTEWDVQALYDYTDDVQVGAVYGIFFPGSVFRDPYDSTAQQFVTTVSVKF